jgi:LmbE family N-acetylglucosaminyl deacetylase
MNKPRLLAIFAHPYDETLPPGGTLAILARQDVRAAMHRQAGRVAGDCD